MRRNQLLSAVGIMVLVAGALAAQDKQGNLASIEFQKVKGTNVPQYEAGRKQKAAWHKQQNDPVPLLVWETIAGDETGTYLVGHFNQHWADYDKPAITAEADLAEFQKVVGCLLYTSISASSSTLGYRSGCSCLVTAATDSGASPSISQVIRFAP